MQNFDYLRQLALKYPGMKPLAEYCCDAEAFYHSRPELCAISCRKALEWLVQMIYEMKGVETRSLNLQAMLEGQPLREFVGNTSDQFWFYAGCIRTIGNKGAHGKSIKPHELRFCLIDTFVVVGSLLKRLTLIEKYPKFDEALIPAATTMAPVRPEPKQTEESVEQMRQELPKDALREGRQAMKFDTPEQISEAETRRMYIDMLLEEAGWEVMTQKGIVAAGKASIEIPVEGMPKDATNPSGIGYCDYVLYNVDARPLAIVEAKRTTVDAKAGRHQAELYADCMERKYGYRPVIFYTNGMTTFIQDGCGYPDRQIYGFYTLRDLQYLLSMRGKLHIADTSVDETIAGRYYQLAAIKATAEQLNAMKRHALLVMATGTGKTRTAIALVDMLLRNDRVKRILFLADRTSLVSQAKKNFTKLLPSLSTVSLNERPTPGPSPRGRGVDASSVKSSEAVVTTPLPHREGLGGGSVGAARMVFSTYHTMINLVNAEEKPFSVGHFDLIIIDEAHRSVFGKFGAIFKYFDALLFGLTATPREEIEKDNYALFHLKKGQPTSYYEYQQAVKDGFLVDYEVIQRHSKLLETGAKYAELSASEREQLDNIFEIEEGKEPGEERDLTRDEMFRFFYNTDTIDKMLQDVMKNGLRIDQGERLGKTIIFAFNHRCAELICERFDELYPHLNGFCQLIDNQVAHPQDLIDRFSLPSPSTGGVGGGPQIAVSVDMLDTGIDVPEVLNLVFFKRVHSRIKFQQMIGRGTRLCPDIFGPGKDKKKFLIFDYCNVFEYFDEHPEGAEGVEQVSLTQRLFKVRLQIAEALQDAKYQEDAFAKQLHDELKVILHGQVCDLSSKIIAVRENWELIERFRKKEAWEYITEIDVRKLDVSVGPILRVEQDDLSAKTFDFIMLNIALARLVPASASGTSAAAFESRAMHIAEALLHSASIPEVKARIPTLKQMTQNEFWNNAGLRDLERVRIEVRELVKHLTGKKRNKYVIDIEDVITEGHTAAETSAVYGRGQGARPPYHERVMNYLMEHGDHPVLRKIKRLEQLTMDDLRELERILWQELGTEEEYRAHCGGRIFGNVAIFIRSIEGLDRQVAIQRFTELLQSEDLSSTQMEYLDTIINYVSRNGDITTADFSDDRPLGALDWADVFGDEVGTIVQYVNEIHDATNIA